MDGETNTNLTQWGRSSEAVNPPSDSAMISLIRGGNIDLERDEIFYFLRELNFTFVALPTSNKDTTSSPVDTIVDIFNSGIVPENSINAFFKFFNAVPNEDVNYKLRLGCPSGQELLNFPVNYRSYSSVFEVKAIEDFTISLIRVDGTEEEAVNTFEIIPEIKNQYTIFVAGDVGDEQLFLLDESNNSDNSLIELIPTDQKENQFRLVNLTDAPIAMSKNGELFTNSLLPETISDIYTLGACLSSESETFSLFSSGTFIHNEYSTDVNKLYSGIVVNNLDSGNDTVIFYPPAEVNDVRSGKSIIRVLNASERVQGLGLTMGATSSEIDPTNPSDTSRNYSSGKFIAGDLDYMELSQARIFEPGFKPINIFTATQPSFYKYSFNLYLEADKDYLIVTYTDESGNVRYSIIEDDAQAEDVERLEEGVLVNYVNAWSLPERVDLDINTINGTILSSGRIFYENSIATIVPAGNVEFNSNISLVNSTAEVGKRLLVIQTGDLNEDEIVVNEVPMIADFNLLNWRFINAAPDIQSLDVKADDGRDTTDVVTALPYKSVSIQETRFNERKLSFYFYSNSEEIFIAKDIFLPLAKNYSLIFTGTEELGYSLIIQQEF